MTKYDSAIDRDANRVAISYPLPFLVSKTMTFDGATENDPGDQSGTGNPATLFTVTGSVLVNVFGIVSTAIDDGQSATLEVGTSDSSSCILGQTAAGDLSIRRHWVSRWVTDITGSDIVMKTKAGISLPIQDTASIISGGLDIIQTVGTGDINTGVLTYYCFWRPLSVDGNVVAA